MLVYVEIVHIYEEKKYYSLSRQGEASKDKIYAGKSPHSVSHFSNFEKLIFLTSRWVWLRAVLVNFWFSKNCQKYFEKSTNGPLASLEIEMLVLVCAESLISRISSRKRIIQQNHFSLLIRVPGVFDSINEEKNCQNISGHCHFKEYYLVNILQK